MDTKRRAMGVFIAAIIVLLAVLPAGVAAATTLFEDNFENLNNWTAIGDVVLTNDPTYAPSWGGYYARFSGGNATADLISSTIDTTCMKNITLSFAIRTVNLTVSEEKLEVQFNDSSSWHYGYTDNLSWFYSTLRLPDIANDNPTLQIKFTLENADLGEYAFIDNVIVTGEPMVCEAPLVTPIGLVALLVLLSVVATSTIVRSKKS